MADIRPFRAIRPKNGLEKDVAALPYDVYNRQEAKEAVKGKELSFLRIDRAETLLPDEIDTYDDAVYEKAKSLYLKMREEGIYIQEEEPAFYLYELTMNGRSQTGIVACASVDDYENGVIKKHENTRADKEADRIRHVDTLNAQTGPIFLAYRYDNVLGSIKNQIRERVPLFDFYSEDNIRHRGWKIDDLSVITFIQNQFRQMDRIYIADGHHRCASAVKVSKKRREQYPDYAPDAQFHYFLAVLFSDDELCVYDYNRVVKDLNGLTAEQFLDRISEHFAVSQAQTVPFKPQEKGTFGMLLDGEWYCLKAKESLYTGDCVKDLDVSLLQDYLLAPILGIGDPKTDKRIDFVGGIRGLKELERRCHTDCRVAFSMYPTSMAELFAVADAGRLMPPKSTWFEPKLRSGLFIHELQ